MASPTLWPTPGPAQLRTMDEMLYDLAGDLGHITNGKLDFYIDAVGVSATLGPPTHIRYNCYIRVATGTISHLFLQVTTPSSQPFPAELGTPEGDDLPKVSDEVQLKQVMHQVLQRPRTKEVVDYLLRLAVRHIP